MKKILIDPLANYLPASLFRGLLKFGKSEMAAANWADPGGWRSMVISYNARCPQIADKVLIGQGVMAMALRNRRKLTARLLRQFIEAGTPPVHVLCLGAGPGHIIVEALATAKVRGEATLVDLNSDAFEYGRALAEQNGVADRVRFIQGDVRDVRSMLDKPPAVVKMIGICEYLTDEQIVGIASAVREVMPPGSPIVFNNLTMRHGNDRFFRRVLGLHMYHRSVAELTALMRQAGFDGFEVHDEPLGVYSVIAGYCR
jgi:SAM-dependent methyltransferase